MTGTPTTVWGRVSPTETLFPILLLESVVNQSRSYLNHLVLTYFSTEQSPS